MTELSLAGLWDALTWHTLIEVVAIIVAALIVHPALSLIKYVFNRAVLGISATSRNRARKRIQHMLSVHKRISKTRARFIREPALATVKTASENLQLIYLGILIVLLEGIFGTFTLTMCVVFLFVLTFWVLRLSIDRRKIIDFDEFTYSTQLEILQLRHKADFDLELLALWKSTFGADAPFAALGKIP